MNRWLWLCPVLALVLAGIALWAFELSWLSALGVAFVLSCPAVAIWTLREARWSFGERDRLIEELTRQRRNHG